MNREIKFRAWDMVNKVMVQVWGINYKDFDGNIIASCFAVNPVIKEEYLLKSENAVLMQFTGRRDKVGKEIFEGDIVKSKEINLDYDGNDESLFYREITSFVTYTDHGFWIEEEDFGWEGENLWNWDDLEVIGNIYQNPELIKTTSQC